MVVKYYILIDLDSNLPIDFEGKRCTVPYRYCTLNEAQEAKDRIGNCYIDLKREEEDEV